MQHSSTKLPAPPDAPPDAPPPPARWRMPVRVGLLVTLAALSLLLWGRLLLKEVPRTAVAEPEAAIQQLAPPTP